MKITEHEEINILLECLLIATKQILDDKLFGVYLYGSLVWGDFDYDISDVDLLVVTESDIDKKEFSRFDNLHLELIKKFPYWDDRIEVAYISKNALKTFKTQRSQIAVISPGESFNIKDAGTDWLINWYLIRKKSISLLGPDPETFIESISKQEYFSAVINQMNEWYDWIVHTKTSRPYQSYVVLTICRGLYVLQNGEQVSKKQAALWIQKNYPQWAPIIEKAITWRTDYKNKEVDPTLTYNEVEKFVREMIKMGKHLTATSHTEAIEWAMKVLKQAEINTAVVVETPWSNVLKISTPQGPVYLKQTPPDLFLEVDVIQKCRELCGITNIPEVISANMNLHCFLMKECGDVSLRTMFDGHLNVDLLVQGLQVYKNIQQATAAHLDPFLQAGVPDWRLEKFPKLYQALVSDEAFLKGHGLEAAQIQILQNAVNTLETLCHELSNYEISECLNHSDFHDNNMLYSNATQKVSIIDLGETAINHPLFSLAAFLKIPSNLYNVAFTSIDYQKLHETCFDGWLDDKKNMTRVVEIINILLPVYLLFAQKRFLDAINLPYNAYNPMSVKQHDKINKGFIWFIDNMEANYGNCVRK